MHVILFLGILPLYTKQRKQRGKQEKKKKKKNKSVDTRHRFNVYKTSKRRRDVV